MEMGGVATSTPFGRDTRKAPSGSCLGNEAAERIAASAAVQVRDGERAVLVDAGEGGLRAHTLVA